MTSNQANELLSDDAQEEHKPLRMPFVRTFVVRKWNADHTALIEIVLEAHIVQFIAPSHVQFIDIELDSQGTPVSRLHRIIYNVEEVEDMDRPMRSRLIAH